MIALASISSVAGRQPNTTTLYDTNTSTMTGIDQAQAVAAPVPNAVPQAAAEHDSDDDSAHSYVCTFNDTSQRWECMKDYKKDVLQQVIDGHDNLDGRKTIDQLKDFGITVYLTEQANINLSILKKVVEHASNNDRSKEHQRCLLYKDDKGRLYNLTLNNGSSGLAGTWSSLLLTFSGLQAVVAMSVLTRAFSCYDEDMSMSVYPGYLSLLLGLILYEEMSQVWLNCSMFIRGTPSVAAYTLFSNFDSDWPRKLSIFILALAAMQDVGGEAQRYLTLVGIGISMSILAANLGSRAWFHLKLKPMGQGGMLAPIAPIISYLAAVFTGLIFPYIGFNQIQAGGKAAIQLIVTNCVIVAAVFVLSDLDTVQNFIVVGSEVS